ncbi:MAG TPA: glutathione peroxidase [Chitinophagaceae bacterium]|nr:glutathione peroxidase [Chitinophagaceae bacterium]
MKLTAPVARKSIRLHKDPPNPPAEIYNLHVEDVTGNNIPLAQAKGKNLLLVNTASDCGYTAQYASLEELRARYPHQLLIIGFPSNEFKEQEKADDESILQFCRVNYGVHFPLSKKSNVLKGDGQHPVYRWLTSKGLNGWNDKAPEWNFSKYLLDEKGRLLAYFGPQVDPLSKEICQLIEQ